MPRGRPRKAQTSAGAPKRTALPALPSEAEMVERFKDFPAIEVLSRRFINPGDPGSLPILLKDESAAACVNSEHMNRLRPGATRCHLCKQPARKWFVYWANTDKQGRWAQMKAKGYVAVEVKELQDSQDVADLVRQAEDDQRIFVRRGDRGKEILCKQPLEAFNYIKTKQREAASRRDNSKAALTQELAEATRRELGDEAGSFMADGGIQVESMTRSRTTLQEEAEGID